MTGGERFIIPDELRGIVSKLAEVTRFTKYRPIIYDNDFAHTVDCVRIAVNIELNALLSGEQVNKIIKILWVHDIPEVLTGDTLTTVKAAGIEYLSVPIKVRESEDGRYPLN